jgi:hypothetical protein
VRQDHVDVREARNPLAQHVIDRRLVQELLRRVPATARPYLHLDERRGCCVDEHQRKVWQHVRL